MAAVQGLNADAYADGIADVQTEMVALQSMRHSQYSADGFKLLK